MGGLRACTKLETLLSLHNATYTLIISVQYYNMDSLRSEQSHARVGSLMLDYQLIIYKPTSSAVTVGMGEVSTTFDSNVFVD